mmetsp:Transcript_79522/g.184568  ORF Transcript_79522/g.184568 Transcript_79522/m.184568 type:complete len:229 (+) Transcript_79522:193-879(+)
MIPKTLPIELGDLGIFANRKNGVVGGGPFYRFVPALDPASGVLIWVHLAVGQHLLILLLCCARAAVHTEFGARKVVVAIELAARALADWAERIPEVCLVIEGPVLLALRQRSREERQHASLLCPLAPHIVETRVGLVHLLAHVAPGPGRQVQLVDVVVKPCADLVPQAGAFDKGVSDEDVVWVREDNVVARLGDLLHNLQLHTRHLVEVWLAKSRFTGIIGSIAEQTT